jgi:hypothetical protein
MNRRREFISDRWSMAFNAAGYALSEVALFLIVVAIVACEMSIISLERAYRYFERKEYAWLVPGGSFATGTQRHGGSR